MFQAIQAAAAGRNVDSQGARGLSWPLFHAWLTRTRARDDRTEGKSDHGSDSLLLGKRAGSKPVRGEQAAGRPLRLPAAEGLQGGRARRSPGVAESPPTARLQLPLGRFLASRASLWCGSVAVQC